MPDDKKAKGKTSDEETDQSQASATPQSSDTGGTAATEVPATALPKPEPLTYEQMERLRRRLRAKYH